jgi:hypothetical protein
LKQFAVLSVSNAVDVDLTTTLGQGTTYTFQTVGETMAILWTGSAWAVLSIMMNQNVTNFSGVTTADIS